VVRWPNFCTLSAILKAQYHFTGEKKEALLWQFNFVDWKNKTYYFVLHVKMPEIFSRF
jgi:hypothetical protein